MNPIISIIIPTFNRSKLLLETLDSIKKQSFKDWECIIVDDWSTDNTELVVTSYIRSDFRFKYFKRPEHKIKGANACRNYGLEISTGKFVNWFDDDDIMQKNKLDKQYNILMNNTAPICICQSNTFENSINNILMSSELSIQKNENLLNLFVTQKFTFLTQVPLFKKSFLLKNNLFFDESLQAAQEWEFLARSLYHASDNVILCNEYLVYYRRHNKSISLGMDYENRKWNYYLARAKIYKFLASENYFKENIMVCKYLENYMKTYFGNLLFSGNDMKINKLYNEDIKHFYSYFKRFEIIIFKFIVKYTSKGFAIRFKIIN